MSTFFIWMGLIFFFGGLLFLLISDGDDGVTGVGIGVILTLCGLVGKYIIPDIKEIPKTETIAVDSTQTSRDSIGEIIFVVSWKDEDGVWCGQNVKIRGRIDKNIGDTIIVKIPN